MADSHKSIIPGLGWKVGLIVISRLVLNTARRFAYPFAPVLSRGLGVSLPAISSLIAVNQASTILGVFIGPLTDQLGYRRMMLMSLGMLTIGMFAASLLPFYSVVMLALLLAGFGKTVFDPAVQAYVSELVPFDRRGRAIGILEFAWAGSSLLGIPMIAFLINRWGWRTPFFAFCGIGLLNFTALWIFLPRERTHLAVHRETPHFFSTLQRLLKERVAVGTIGFAFFVCLANDNLFVVYGIWLEQSFQLSIIAIGIGTSIIGIAELSGEFLTATIGDTVGLKRGVFIGVSCCVASYLLLPILGRSLPFALGGLFLVFLSTEASIVMFLSLCTELFPRYRATMMAGFFAASGLGRISGALTGGAVWLWGGIWATGIISALSNVLAFAILAWGLWGWKQDS